MKIKFLRQSFKKYSYDKLHKNPSVGADLFQVDGQTDRQTDMTKLIIAFRKISKSANK
jgi:hypothetical protein